MNKRPTHTALKKRALTKPQVQAEYNALEEEFALIRQLLHARLLANKSQMEIAKAMHTTASAISRLEGGGGKKGHSPSLSTLSRYAKATGCRLLIQLIPEKNSSQVLTDTPVFQSYP